LRRVGKRGTGQRETGIWPGGQGFIKKKAGMAGR
jgi:hypothetical protein